MADSKGWTVRETESGHALILHSNGFELTLKKTDHTRYVKSDAYYSVSALGRAAQLDAFWSIYFTFSGEVYIDLDTPAASGLIPVPERVAKAALQVLKIEDPRTRPPAAA